MTHMDLKHMQTHPLCDSAPGQNLEGHKWHMGKRGEKEVIDNRARAGRELPPRQSPEARQWHCPISEPSPTQSHKVVKQFVSPM